MVVRLVGGWWLVVGGELEKPVTADHQPLTGYDRLMHIVLVLVTIRPEMRTAFEEALLHNARESVAHDRGCRRFDVSHHADDPHRWVLHEVYDDPAAHAEHRRSP